MLIGAVVLSLLFFGLGVVELRADFYGLPLAAVGLAVTASDTRLLMSLVSFGFAGVFALLGSIAWYLKAIY